MTTIQFRKAMNAELKSNDLGECEIEKVITVGIQTVLIFRSGLHMKCIKWLNNRFAYGISLEENNYKTVYINTPMDKRVKLN